MGRAFVLPLGRIPEKAYDLFLLYVPPSVVCNCLGKEIKNARKHHGSHRGLTGAPTVEWLDVDDFDDGSLLKRGEAW